MKLNEQQLIAAKAYQSSKKHIAVIARAGTGKTTFLLALAKLAKSKSALFLAFTNATKEELVKRDPTVGGRVKTTYSVGLKACNRAIEGNVEIVQFKYETIVDDLTDSDNFKGLCMAHGIKPGIYKTRQVKREMVNMVNSVLLNLKFTKDEISDYVANNFELSHNVETWLVFEAVKQGLMDANNGEISFSDMISYPFCPYIENPSELFDSYPVVFVDEAQDLSMAQIRIVEESARGGQLVAVGDRQQAIFGFAGATGNSFDYLVDSFEAEQFPMDLCYRCPVEVLDKARTIVPDIRGLDRSGIVKEISNLDGVGYSLLRRLQKEPTLVTARVNSYLLKLAIHLLENDIPFNFHRSNVEDKLRGIINISKETTAFNNFRNQMLALKDQYEAKKNLSRIDDIDCILLILDKSGARKYSELLSYLKKLFYKRAASLLLGTTHSFKGNEEKNVVIWGIEMYPHPKAETEAQLEQESNLEYIAYTRAKENLFIVNTSD